MTTAVEAAPIVAALDDILTGWERTAVDSTSYPVTEYLWTSGTQRVVCIDQRNGRWVLHARVAGGEWASGSDIATAADAVGILRLLIGGQS